MAAQVPTTSQDEAQSTTKLSQLLNKVARLFSPEKLQAFKRFPKLSRKTFTYLAVAVVVVAAGIWFFGVRSTSDTADFTQASYVAEGPRVELNKRFNVPIRSSKGDSTGSDLVVNVTTLERTDKILYKGKPLVARSGKDFLVINLEVENSTNNRLTVRPVDFFRLVDTNGKTYAPDIQTDPVKVEPLSSKKTRTMYIISEDQKTIKLMIGEIKGENKETVEVSI